MAWVVRPACRPSAGTSVPSNQAMATAGRGSCAAWALRLGASAMGVTVAFMVGIRWWGQRLARCGIPALRAGLYRYRDAVVHLGQLLLQRTVGALALHGHPQCPVVVLRVRPAVDRQRPEAAALGGAEHARQHAFGAAQGQVKLIAHCSVPGRRAMRTTAGPRPAR